MCTNAHPTSLHDKQLGCYGLTTGTHKEQICGAKTMQGGHATIQMARFKLQSSALLHELKHNVGNALFNETGLLQSSPPQSHRRRTVPARLIEQPILNVTIIALAQQAGKALGAPSTGMEHQLLVDPHQTCTRSPGNMTTVTRIVAFTVPRCASSRCVQSFSIYSQGAIKNLGREYGTFQSEHWSLSHGFAVGGACSLGLQC